MNRERTVIVDDNEADFYYDNAIKLIAKLEDTQHLYTKPFCVFGQTPNENFFRNFYSFLNMVRGLNLPGGAKILDVGCGSGWISEFLWRCGYNVTGIDISDKFIYLAAERVKAVHYKPQKGSIHFKVLNIEKEYLDEQFDAIVCYGTLHHTVNEKNALLNMRKMLYECGQLYIRDPAMPQKGSDAEKFYLEETEKYGTFESPLSLEYLLELLKDLGFVDITSYVEINCVFIQDDKIMGNIQNVLNKNRGTLNIVRCRVAGKGNYFYTSRQPHILNAEIKAINRMGVKRGEKFTIKINVKNIGDTLWISDSAGSYGSVTVGVKLYRGKDLIDQIKVRTYLPYDIKPGSNVEVTIQYKAPEEPGKYTMKIDMVDERITWFEDAGSNPILLDMIVE